MATLETNDANLYYEIHGQGPPVLLAHGVGGNHASWYQQVPVLSANYQVIAIDHRGFGNSTDPSGAARSRFVDDLISLLDHLEIEQVILIAQSMGGGTCSGFASRCPQRVRALVLADTLVGMQQPAEISELMTSVRAKTDNLSQLERVLGARFRAEHPNEALLYQQIASFNKYVLKTLPGRLPDTCAAEQLAATGSPCLFIAGSDDILFPPEAIRAFQQRVTGSAYVEIPQAGHSAYFEKPAEFNAAVVNFLNSID